MKKIFAIGLDGSVLQKDSASAHRQRENYAGVRAEILVLSSGESACIKLSDSIQVSRAGGANKIVALFRTCIFAWKKIHEFQPDAITVQDPFWSAFVALFGSFGKRIPLHVQDHSGFFARRPYGLVEHVLWPFAWMVVQSASRIRTVSERGARGLQNMGVPAENIDVIPLAVNLSPFLTLEREPTAFPTIVCASRLEKEKGIDLLLQSFAMVRKTNPEARLDIIGDGSQRKRLEKLAQDLQISQSVIFHGMQKDIVPFLRRASIYVQPSRFEGYGIAVLEAASAGCPIVMTDVGCAGELIEDGIDGRVVPTENAQKFADGMIELINDPQKAKLFGMTAQVKAKLFLAVAQLVHKNRQSFQKAMTSTQALPIFFVCMVALFVRLFLLGYLLWTHGSSALWFGDTDQYGGIASSLVSGHGFSLNGALTDVRPPLYPLLMAGGMILNSLGLVVAFQLIVSSFLPAVGAWFGRELGMTSRSIRWGMWFLALEPHLVFYALPYLTDTFVMMTFLFAVAFLYRGIKTERLRLWIWAGVFMGLNLLLKPAFQLFPVALFIGIVMFERKLIKHVFAFLMITFVVVSPWLIRNQIRFDSFTLNRQGADQALFYLGTSIVSTATGISYVDADHQIRADFLKSYGSLTRREQYLPEAVQLIAKYPFAFVRVTLFSVVSFWTVTNYGYLLNHYQLISDLNTSVLPPTHYLAQGHYKDFFISFWGIFSQPYFVFGAIGRLFWAIIDVFMLVGWLNLYRRNVSTRALLWLLLLAMIIYTATVAINGLGVEGRLRLPFIPFQLLLAMIAFEAWKKRV